MLPQNKLRVTYLFCGSISEDFMHSDGSFVTPTTGSRKTQVEES
jgi:hypothetical protein